MQVVRFVRCGGLAPLLAPGRGTYGSVRGQRRAGCFSAAKGACSNILKCLNGGTCERFPVLCRSGAGTR